MFWLTNTGVSSRSRTGSTRVGSFATSGTSSIPVAVSVFPDELYQAPRSWAEEAYPNLVHFNELDKGGHFAAWEQPELYAEELRDGAPVAPLDRVTSSFERLHMPSLGGATEWLNSERTRPRPSCRATSSASTYGR